MSELHNKTIPELLEIIREILEIIEIKEMENA